MKDKGMSASSRDSNGRAIYKERPFLLNMLLSRERKRIEAMGYFTAVFDADIVTSPDADQNRYWFEGLQYAMRLGKPFYVLYEKGYPPPPGMLQGADIQDMLEYDGPVGSDSFRDAAERVTRSIAWRHGVDRIPVDDEGADTDPGLS